MTVSEYIQTLPPEEQEQHKDLIAESIKREQQLNQYGLNKLAKILMDQCTQTDNIGQETGQVSLDNKFKEFNLAILPANKFFNA